MFILYGVAKRLDFSLRLESYIATITPRFQILRELGKTLGHFEPYLSYVFKYGTWPADATVDKPIFGLGGDPRSAHFFKVGTRFNIPNSVLFLQLEGGVSIWNLSGASLGSSVLAIAEGAAGLGIRLF